MTSSPLLDVNETMRHFAIRAFKAMGVSNVSRPAKSDLLMPAPIQALNRPFLDGMMPGAGMATTPLDSASNASLSLSIPAADWDLLYSAIVWRLRLAAGNGPAVAPAPDAGEAAGKVQAAVLDCVSAMELLHAALTIERDAAASSNASVSRS